MSTAAVTVSASVPVDEGWVEFVTGGPEGFADVFMRDHCGYWARGVHHRGYWARGVRHIGRLGWLVYDKADDESRPTEAEYEAAATAWLAGEQLPKNYYRFDAALATKAFAEGVKKDGVDWYENGDSNDYDCAIQRALFDGKVVYG